MVADLLAKSRKTDPYLENCLQIDRWNGESNLRAECKGSNCQNLGSCVGSCLRHERKQSPGLGKHADD